VDGARATADLLPRRGRASYLGERALGTPDPGAVGVAIVLAALLDIADVTHPPDQEDLLDEAFRIDDHIMLSRDDYESGRS